MRLFDWLIKTYKKAVTYHKAKEMLALLEPKEPPVVDDVPVVETAMDTEVESMDNTMESLYTSKDMFSDAELEDSPSMFASQPFDYKQLALPLREDGDRPEEDIQANSSYSNEPT